MKKKIFLSVFIIALLICGAIYAAKTFGLFSYMITEQNITSFTVTGNNQQHSITDSTMTANAVKAINYSMPFNKSFVELTKLTDMGLVVDGEQRNYTVYCDTKKNFYLEYQGRFAKVLDNNSFAKIFSMDIFSNIYPAAVAPSMNLVYNNTSIPVENISTGWKYKRFDGEVYTADYDKAEKTETISKGPYDSLYFNFTSVPDLINIDVLLNGSIVGQLGVDDINSYMPKQDGIYTYKVYAQWKAKNNEGFGTVCYTFNVKYDIDPCFTLSSNVVELGEELVIRARNITNPANISAVSSYPYTPVFYPYNDEYVALLPVSYMSALGTYNLELRADNYSQKFSFEVINREFETQNLKVDNNTLNSTVNSAEASAEYNAAVAQIDGHSESAWYCDKAFIQPVENYELTTPFGVKRYVNGAKKASRHPGIDMAIDAGTPVTASNNGKIAYAGYLKMTGNTVVIDHGFGLKTWYLHMNSLNVKPGDIVKKGVKIGEVGSTGYSTGPHLHFEATVNGTSVNPWTLFKNNPLTIEQPKPEQANSNASSSDKSSSAKSEESKSSSSKSGESKSSSSKSGK